MKKLLTRLRRIMHDKFRRRLSTVGGLHEYRNRLRICDETTNQLTLTYGFQILQKFSTHLLRRSWNENFSTTRRREKISHANHARHKGNFYPLKMRGNDGHWIFLWPFYQLVLRRFSDQFNKLLERCHNFFNTIEQRTHSWHFFFHTENFLRKFYASIISTY